MFLGGIGVCCVYWVMTGKCSPLSFPANVPHGPDWYWRMNRMHLNALENLPLFAGLVFAATLLQTNLALIDSLACIVLVGRVAQSFFHLISYRGLWVNFRFVAFGAQVVSMLIMAITILTALN